MTLPASLVSVAFPSPDAHTLCGIALGDPFSSLALPGWWSDSHSDGDVRFGWLDVGDGGVDQLCCSVTRTLGRVSRVEVSIEIADGDAEERVFTGLRELLAKRTGLPGKKERKRATFSVAGAYESSLAVRLAGFSMQGDRVHRVELTLELAPGFEITADPGALFVDTRALAAALASEAWPADRCKEVLDRYFSKDAEYLADEADRADYRRILDAARDERPEDLPARMDRVCAIVPWDDVQDGRDAKRSTYVLKEIGAYSYNISARRQPGTGRWLRTNPLDVVCFLKLLAVPAAERGQWAARLVRALEWGEPAAMEAVRERVKQTPIEPWSTLVWDAADDVEARAFDLVTSGLASAEERALWPLSVTLYASSAARACVRFFEAQGMALPPHAPPAAEDHSAQDWAEYALLVKAHLPARTDDMVVKLFEKLRLHPRTLRAVCEAAADGKGKSGEKTTWQIGQHEVSHSGNPTAGRWTLRRTTPITPPRPRASGKGKTSAPAATTSAAAKGKSAAAKGKAAAKPKAKARARAV